MLTHLQIRDFAIIEAAELGVRERLSRAKVNLDVHIAKGAGTVMADSNRLIQVIYNLLSNAMKCRADLHAWDRRALEELRPEDGALADDGDDTLDDDRVRRAGRGDERGGGERRRDEHLAERHRAGA